MLFVIFLVLLLLALASHELSHGIAMRRNGIKVPEAGLGFPIPHLPSLKIRISPTLTFYIHPFLLGAYVKPSNEEDIEILPYSAKTDIYAAGVIANFILGFILLALSLIWAMAIGLELLILNQPITLAVSIILPILLWFGRRIFSRYLFPFLGFPLVGYLAWSIATHGIGQTVMGPVGAVQIALKLSNLPEILLWGGAISIGLGLVNLMPIVPLDGGRTLLALIERIFGEKPALERIVTLAGVLAISLLIITVMYSDIFRVLH